MNRALYISDLKYSVFMLEICYALQSIFMYFVFRTDKYYIVELSEDWVIRLGSKIETLCNGNWLLLMSHIYISTDTCFVLSRTYQLARVKYLYSYIYYIYILYIYVIYIYIYNIAYLESIHTIVVFKLTNDSLFWCLH